MVTDGIIKEISSIMSVAQRHFFNAGTVQVANHSSSLAVGPGGMYHARPLGNGCKQVGGVQDSRLQGFGGRTVGGIGMCRRVAGRDPSLILARAVRAEDHTRIGPSDLAPSGGCRRSGHFSDFRTGII